MNMPAPSKNSSKYDVLAQNVGLLRERMIAQHRLLRSTLLSLRNLDARHEAMRKVLVEKGLMTVEEYNTVVDANLGLRLRGADELIQKGDVVWVSYVGEVDGEDEKIEQTNMPIRVGSNSIVFEEALVGHPPHVKGVPYEATYNVGSMKGKKIKFTIDIHQVKQNMKGAGDGEKRGDSGDADGDAVNESDVEIGGSRITERSNSERPVIQ